MPASSASVQARSHRVLQPAHSRSPGRVFILLLLSSNPLHAQQFRVDLTASNRDLWRGLNRTTTWVAQTGASASAPLWGGDLAAGVWENRELGRSKPGQLTEVGQGRRGLGERDLWVEYRSALGSQELFLGVIHYTFHGDAAVGGRSSAENTTEVALGLHARLAPLSPTLAAYWDVDRVKGWYLEGSGAVPLLAWPFPPQISVLLDVDLGLDLAEGPNSEHPDEIAYYAGNGITHLALGLTIDLQQSEHLTSSLGAHLQVGRDEATKLGAAGRSRSAFGTCWIGGTLRLGRSRP